MRGLLRLPSAYLALPLLLACTLTWLTYDLPAGYLAGVCLLAGMALAVMVIDLMAGVRLPALGRFRARNYVGTREAFLALMFAWGIVFFCMLDLTLFPIPLIVNPSAYANMEGGREHVRHISDMCWVLPVIGMVCTRNRAIRYLLIAIGVLFPVLVIDRNRLFATVFSAGLVLLLRRDEARPLPWKTIALLAVGGCTVFSVLGMVRSGLDFVTLPFSAVYRASPLGIKWLLLYITAGPYNFGAILAKHYVNTHFLMAQLVPMSGSVATAGTGIPLDAENINVGTEFFPFLMAFGPLGAAAAMVLLFLWMSWSAHLLWRGVSLFPLLIFLRMSYVCVMAPFAPQAFTWTNFGFIALCLAMQVFAAWLPNRHDAFHHARAAAPPFH